MKQRRDDAAALTERSKDMAGKDNKILILA
jgi:hypothetical protein